jgi:hypothetical protein
VEHRLVGAEPDSVASTAPPGEWNAIGDGEAPDTLLGPEGSGVQLTSGREARTLIADEPPAQPAGAETDEGPPVC